MASVLVIDASPFAQELLPTVLEQIGYVAQACAPCSAIPLINQLRPDLVILEAGDVAGMALLQSLRTDLIYKGLPVLVLTDQTSRAAIVQAARLGVREYMLKQRFSKAELLARIRKYALPSTTASAPEFLQKPDPSIERSPGAANDAWATAEEDAKGICDAALALGIPLLSRELMLSRLESAKVKTLPGAVAELLSVVNSPHGSVGEVATTLRRDPVLSAKVLRMANSAAYATQRSRILSIEDAVKQIGLTGVHKLVVACGVFEIFSSGAREQSLLQSWQHSLAVAMLMEKLTPPDDSVPPGVPYVVGLCHDLADIVLRQHFCQEYERVLELTQRTGKPQRRVESALFGIPYSELVSLLFSRLGLPGVVTAPIQEFFERTIFPRTSGGGSLMGRTLRIANICAHGLMLAPSLDEPILPLSKIECRNTFGETMPILDGPALRNDVLIHAAALMGGHASEAIQSIKPTTLRVCYVRHPEYADLDPLHSFLSLHASQVSVRSAVPRNSMELDEVDLLVCAASRSEESSRVHQITDQLASLTRSRAFPIFIFSREKPAASSMNPRHIQIECLPTSLRAIQSFLAQASTSAAKLAA